MCVLDKQVPSTGVVNIIFTQPLDSWDNADEVSMFLECNEEILLDGHLLLDLCAHPLYRMDCAYLARAVALAGAVDSVLDACINREDMIAPAAEEDSDEQEEGEEEDPQWLANANPDDDDSYDQCSLGARHSSAMFANQDDYDPVIPIVRLMSSRCSTHHPDRFKELCKECNAIFEDPESVWHFLDRSNALPFGKWVEFVVRQVQLDSNSSGNRSKDYCLCIRLISNRADKRIV